jgi:hypothetical protein
MREPLLKLNDFDPEWYYGDDDIVVVRGNPYPYEMTLSSDYPDNMCQRVKINDKYYYFG